MEDKDWPSVTVFSLVYNTGKYVVEALEAVKRNGYPNLQHIIIDDFSKDNSVQIVDEWIKLHNYDCVFVKHVANQGVCKTLNEVLRLSSGKFIFGISDDLINDNYIKTSVEILQNAGDDYCVAFCNSSVIDENGKDLGIDHYGSHGISMDNVPTEYAFESIIQSNFINGIGALYRRQYIEEVGGYDESLYFEDWDLHIRLLRKYKVKKIDQILTQYRRRSNSISTGTNYKYYESLILITIKLMNEKFAEPQLLKKNLIDFAEYYFRFGGRSGKIYRKVFNRSVHIKSFMFLIFSKLGINYNHYKKLVALIK